MISGYQKFRDYFKDYPDEYVVIGGAACSILFDSLGLSFRATKDFDLVIAVNPVNPDFIRKVWEFVKAGKYDNCSREKDKNIYYRFNHPADTTFPYMLEIFAPRIDSYDFSAESRLTPVPVHGEVSSLSAILLDNDYFDIIFRGSGQINGISVLKPEYLVLLKAKAWLDLTERRLAGKEHVDKRNIKKHFNDVMRLSQIIDPGARVLLPESISNDFIKFLNKVPFDNVDLKAVLGSDSSKDNIINLFKDVYSVEIS